ncbi:anti-sigma regulatory factor (Ser/Thr protein kinase) [Streptomyces sp. V3I8]|uniref:ATP-binding protein n=1 Tax=Streptomyces sp. V3I8 TaxID=3042279 RepID=UPI0027870640|nr:ATP-binding protein [Streptomyces sp. V3I8]MDQ1035347.1 anti-sigma regulatory factor (Ser/Thr protein kinase) [Streptomyces sp. V3I8]
MEVEDDARRLEAVSNVQSGFEYRADVGVELALDGDDKDAAVGAAFDGEPVFRAGLVDPAYRLFDCCTNLKCGDRAILPYWEVTTRRWCLMVVLGGVGGRTPGTPRCRPREEGREQLDSDGEGTGRTAPTAGLMQASYALDAGGGCIAQARRHALAFLDRAVAEHRVVVPARARDLTQLVVSELVTNALKYAPGPVMMKLGITTQWVEVTMWDSAPVMPVAQRSDPGRIGQHGLEIVKAVSAYLVVRPDTAGKRITAHIALADPPGEAVARTLV